MYAPRRASGGPGSSPLMMTFQEMFKSRASPAQSMYANLPAIGQAMSPMAQVGRADRKIAQADRDLGRLGAKLFAEGGKVGVSAAALKKLKDELSVLSDRDRAQALDTLRASRATISALSAPAASGPATRQLAQFVESPAAPPPALPPAAVALADGGTVGDAAQDENPAMMYGQYVALLKALEDPETPGGKQSEILAQLGQLEEKLEALGVNLTWDPSSAGEGQSGEVV